MAESAKTASGLLYDAVATTARLSVDERKKHKEAQEVLAAFCLHYCVIALSNPSRYCHVGGDITIIVARRIIRYIMAFIKRKIDAGEPIVKLRSCLIGLARKKHIDIFKQLYEKDTETGKWVPKDKSISLMETEEKQNEIIASVVEKVLQKAREQAEKERFIADVGALIDECRGRRILTKDEVLIICHSFGLGEGYELLTQREIAEKIKRDASTVSRQLNKALQKLKDFIMQEPDYRHLARTFRTL